MSSDLPHRRSGLLLSGGIDSAVLLDQLLQRERQVVPFYVRTGCAWESAERTAVHRFLSAIDGKSVAPLIELEVPLHDLYGDHWSMTGTNVPDDDSPDEAVYMPGHNPLLLIKPALWCQSHGIRSLALATLANNPFDDATAAFFSSFEEMIRQATRSQLEIIRPLAHLRKESVMELGRHLPLELTFSCLAPVDGLHCGRCNKCAERRRAFGLVKLDDRTHYFHTATTAGRAVRQREIKQSGRLL
jgi:7-cyano-7-deazaguanine synthase